MPGEVISTNSSSTVRELVHRTEGQDLIEYALLIGMLSVVLISSLGQIGTRVSNMYDTTKTAMDADGAAPGASTPGAGAPDDSNDGDSGQNGNPGNGNPGNNNGNPGNSNPGNGNPGNSNPGDNNPGKGK
jgi:Flp pilus assembly pilin Flp